MSRLRQIDSELLALEARREELIREREKLVAEKRPDVVAVGSLSSAEKIALFLSLFRCREDVYPRLWENPKTGMKGYSPVCRNEWFRGVCEKPRVKCSECLHQAFPPFDEVAARDHLTGKSVIGTYAIRENNTCVFLAADFDGAGWKEDVIAYRDVARELGIEVAIERSRSGDGGHAWIFFSEPVSALMARRLGTLIVAKASSLHPAMGLSSYDRFFPNQDALPAGGFGNLIALPLQAKPRELGNSLFLDEDLVPFPDQWTYLAEVRRVSPEQLDELVERTLMHGADTISGAEPLPRFEDRVLDLIPEAVTRGCFSGTATVIRHAQIEIPTEGIPASLVAALKRLATLANPVFYEKQRLRFGTYNIPRFIFCGEIHPGRIVLPPGVDQSVKDLFRKAGGKVQVEDKRPEVDSRSFTFRGELGPAQQIAVDAMLAHDDGVLLAPPGAGKTVMGCAIIAARNVSTLILVHRKPLLEQWRSRLQEFLGLEKGEIGVLAQNSDMPKSGIVIGMVQTLVKSASPAALLRAFPQVIIDECHHVPAASFEAVLKESCARFLLGLTATPNRKDGLQKILFLQCGPIRHKMESDRNSGIARKLIIRDIQLGLPPENTRMPIHQVWDMLIAHEGRNRQIVSDIAESLSASRNCAVLSDRKEHLGMLENLLGELNPQFAGRIHRLDGAMGKKSRAAVFEAIDQDASTGQGFALLATSSLLGEGFDLPQLDTLFLTLPISFKGRLVQYAGRLDRSWPGKSEVRIYDYVEPEHPLTASMFRKRMTAYRSMGYEVSLDDEMNE